MMSPEKHLAAILSAWGDSDGFKISKPLHDALTAAEGDFDGVEDDRFETNTVIFRGEPWPKIEKPGFEGRLV